jgi:hypothetical protein
MPSEQNAMAKETSPEAAPDPLSSLSPDEKRKQALETFKHAAQEIRFTSVKNGRSPITP